MSQPILAVPVHKATLLDAALDYLARGWSIIPVIGKKAAGLWKPFQSEPPDEATLRRLFDKPKVSGLAVILGKVSGGLACRDFDVIEAYHRWAHANRDEASRLPTVRTARGYHVYGRLDQEQFATLGDGEFRADSGHICLLPPSAHPDGVMYQWINPLPPVGIPIPKLPTSLRPVRTERQTSRIDRAAEQKNIACVPPPVFAAITATLPDGPGKRNRQVFELARRLKGIEGLDTSPAALKAIVTEWHRQALPFIRTKHFGETWTDFQIAWLNAKSPHLGAVRSGTTPRTAYESAKLAPMQLDDNTNLGILAAMCRMLAAEDNQFFLSGPTVAELFGVGRTTAWRMLNALRFYDIIEILKVGTRKGTKGPVCATEYRYIGGLRS